MFIDEAQILLISGKGGDGIVHFRREKYVPRGGPDGGDGGKGGDVVLQVNSHLNTLSSFRYQKQFIAKDGARGGPNNRTGKSADDLFIDVPPGTVIYEGDTGVVIGDLVSEGQSLVVAHGGRGGRGNTHFASARNQVPKVAEKGEPGEERTLRLELKLIADIGIVGVPNAGKSTLLSVVTNAKPKIAAYPFTTLEPNLGVVELDDETILVLADIPGLIEGAHMGVGLGHSFLRHIQRTRVLIHLLDGLSEDPILDYAQINSELALFDPDLAEKPQLIVVNKMDLDEVQIRWPVIKKRLEKLGITPHAISAVSGENVRKVLYLSAQLLSTIPEKPEVVDLPLYVPEDDPAEFNIEKTSLGWVVRGKAIERAAQMTYWEYDQSVRRFQRILQTLGIETALRESGVTSGDTVFIGEHELEWQD